MLYLPSEYQAQLLIYWNLSDDEAEMANWNPFVLADSDIAELMDGLDECIAESYKSQIHNPTILRWIRCGPLM